MTKLPDQNEVFAENATLQLRAAALRAEAKNKTGATVSAPSIPEAAKGDCLAINAALKAHVAELEAMLEGKQAPASTQAAKPQTLTEKVLAAKAANQPPTTEAAPVKGESLTARVLKAKGVKTVAELPLPSGLE